MSHGLCESDRRDICVLRRDIWVLIRDIWTNVNAHGFLMEMSDVFRRKLVFATFRFHFFRLRRSTRCSAITGNKQLTLSLSLCRRLSIHVKSLRLLWVLIMHFRMTILSYMYSVCSMSTCVKNDLWLCTSSTGRPTDWVIQVIFTSELRERAREKNEKRERESEESIYLR